jgi:RNA polymerase sigma-70 factor (ECF subfamily)
MPARRKSSRRPEIAGLTVANGVDPAVIFLRMVRSLADIGGCGHSRLPTGSITVLLVWMSLVRWALVLPAIGARRAATLESSARIRQLAHLHLDAICRTARRLGVRPCDLDDVVQDVMLVVVRRLDDIEPDKERAFLVGTTVRVAANRRRQRQRRPEEPRDSLDDIMGSSDLLSASPGRAPGEASVETARQLALLHTALDQMTEAQRVAFVLFELEELTAREIGEQLAVTEGTVVSRVRRAREVLWRVFAEHGYPGVGARRVAVAEEVGP